ncbi:MAG: YaiI/YqxD family protein [Proteobacteria bacterium]|nr:YaiI/YqxD family protein [Pseudomonadota bacterium]
MKIWVDADACPVAIKEILFRAARRTTIHVCLVANHFLSVPASPYISFIKVSKGFDVADNEIVKQVLADDLVVTADIPLAAEVIEKGACALNPRGELYTQDNIKDRLTMRDFMDNLRGSGIDTGGPPALSANDRMMFANALDKYITQARQS